jgi:hypothetical protein
MKLFGPPAQLPRRAQTAPAPARRHLVAVLVAGGLLAGAALASSAAEASPVDRCQPVGRELAHSSAVVVWAKHGETELFACARASGRVHSLPDTVEGVEDLVVAGHFVGYQYSAGEQLTYIEVFNALTARTEVGKVLISCPGDGCPAGADPWRLASSGWVAYDASFGSGGVVATDGHSTPTLDEGPRLQDLRLRGSTLSWSPDGKVHYSAPLGAGLAALAATHTPAPRPLPSACALDAATDVEAVLGPVTAASSGERCIYTSTATPTSAATPTSTATIALAADLSPAQVIAAKHAAYSRELKAFGGNRDEVAPARYSRYDWSAHWEAARGSLTASYDAEFVGDVELTTEVTLAVPYNAEQSEGGGRQIGAGPWGTVEAAGHLSDIAYDRLMGWPVRRTGAG